MLYLIEENARGQTTQLEASNEKDLKHQMMDWLKYIHPSIFNNPTCLLREIPAAQASNSSIGCRIFIQNNTGWNYIKSVAYTNKRG